MTRGYMGGTERQNKTLALIEDRFARNRPAPTCDEICAHLGLRSKSNAVRILRALERRGAIIRTPRNARAIQLINPVIICPHCNNVAGSERCRAAASLQKASGQTRSKTIPIATLAGATVR